MQFNHLNTKESNRLWVFIFAILVLAAACAPVDNSPTPDIEATVRAAVQAAIPMPTPTPTPDIEATSQARIQAAFAAQPTATPIPTPEPTSTLTPAPTPTATPLPLPTHTPIPSLSDVVGRIRPGVVRVATDYSSGSGMIFESGGASGQALVVTNFHVVEGYSSVRVTVNDATTYTGWVKGVDPTRDLAVVSICCGSFNSLSFGDANRLNPGDEVFAVGYALGFSGQATVTKGIVSAIRFDTNNGRWVIQIDAPINPGNSGGPLFSADGQVIGINTFKIESSVSGRPTEGLGFAVSEVTVQSIIAMLKSGNYVPVPTPTRVPPTPTQRPVPTSAPIPTPSPTQIPTPRPTSTQMPASCSYVHIFIGTAHVNGLVAPSGSRIAAWSIDGQLLGSVNVDSSGAYGPLLVRCPVGDQTVVFTVGSLQADQSVIWKAGGAEALNLTAFS